MTTEPAAETAWVDPAAGRGRSVIAGSVRVAFLLAVVGFGVLFVVRARDELAVALAGLSPSAVVGALLAGAAGGFALMLSWRALLADTGSPLPVSAAARVFFVGQLGKYVPGSVWPMLAQTELARDYRVPPRNAMTVNVVSLSILVVTGLVGSGAVLPFTSPGALDRYWWAYPALPFLLALVHPRVLTAIANRVLRVLRRPPLDRPFSLIGTTRCAGWALAGLALLGAHAYLLVLGVGGDAWSSPIPAFGGFVFAFCAGIIAVPLPAGAGAREAILVLVLTPVVAREPALAVALVSRILLAGADFGLAGGQWATGRWRTAANRDPGLRPAATPFAGLSGGRARPGGRRCAAPAHG